MTTITMTTLKQCSTCEAWKPHSKFNRNKGRPDGRESDCGACKKARNFVLASKNGGAYESWRMMKRRVNRNHTGYGARGIRYHPGFETYAGFLAYMGDRPEDTQIDRIDPDGHYEPGNVRWLDKGENFSRTRPPGALADAVVLPPTWEV